MRFALVGYSGYWGSKLGRVLRDLDHDVVAEIDSQSEGDALLEAEADAAIIATPPATHFELAMQAMEGEMDVLIEKPMTLSVGQAMILQERALDEGLVLSIDSTFCHTAAFDYLKNIDEPIITYQSIRMAPPMPQAVIPAGWDLIVHDLSILEALDELPMRGFGAQYDDVSQATFLLQNGGAALIMASRMWPMKERGITIQYPSGAFFWTLGSLQTFKPGSMREDILVTEPEEPLRRLINDFERRCLNRELDGLTDGRHGASVVSSLARVFPDISLVRDRPGGDRSWVHHHAPFESLSLQAWE